jgi:bacterioferritin (cytochrome b1)
VTDFATRERLEDIFKDEDRHIDKLEERPDQIKHMACEYFSALKWDS